VKKLVLLFVASTLLVALNACSAGSASSNQTVSAQTTYSNSSLSGTYSVSLWNFSSNVQGLAPYYSAVGTIQLNGSGNITGGTITEHNDQNPPFPCAYNLTGTYSIQSTALGTATLNLTSSTKGCTSDTWQWAIAAAGDGTAIQIARTDQIGSGSAIKQ
jgi:hypothetical protein